MKLNEADIAKTAQLCHEINRAYQISLGDETGFPWFDSTVEMQESAKAGVRAFVESEFTLTPEQQHNRWMAGKLAAGWRYGPVKDAAERTHPCLVAYEELPMEDRAKDLMFQAAVRTVWLDIYRGWDAPPYSEDSPTS